MDRAKREAWIARFADDLTQEPKGLTSISDGRTGRPRARRLSRTWDRLRRIKAQYDPHNLARLNQNIPPLAWSLWRVAPNRRKAAPSPADGENEMLSKAEVSRPMLTLAGIAGALGVALAARGSHAAEGDLAIAANFLLLHAPVLIGLSLLGANRLAQIAGYVLVVALLLFCGDLAMRSELGHPLFAFAAPAGGAGLILAWLLLAVSAWAGWRR